MPIFSLRNFSVWEKINTLELGRENLRAYCVGQAGYNKG